MSKLLPFCNILLACNLLQNIDCNVQSGPIDGASFDYIVVGAGASGAAVARKLADARPWSVALLESGELSTLSSEIGDLYAKPLEIIKEYRTQRKPNICKGFEDGVCRLTDGKELRSTRTSHKVYTDLLKSDFDRWESMGFDQWGWRDVSKYIPTIEQGVVRYIEKSMTDTSLYPMLREMVVATSTVQAYLRNTPPNLSIFTGAHVTRVIFRNNSAVGVKVLVNRREITVTAKREVILCAGAIRTPHILMLSGVGSKDHLQSLNISVVRDLPVGDNLMSYVSDMGTFVAVDAEESSVKQLNKFVWFLGSDIQIPNMYYTKNDDHSLRHFLERSGVNEVTTNSILEANKAHGLIQYSIEQAAPKSRGRIRLNSTNPSEQPSINPGYFSDTKGEDMDALLAGAKFLYGTVNSEAMLDRQARFVDTKIEDCKGMCGNALWECHFRHLGGSAEHYSGTAAMGSVVDQQLKVMGVDRLRVIDASSAPFITNRNSMPVAFIIGEKGADYIIREGTDHPCFH